MFSRGVVRTGTPTKSPSISKGVGGSSRKKDGGILSQVVVFTGAILIGMVMTIAVCSYFDQTGKLTLERSSESGNVVNVATQLRVAEPSVVSVNRAGQAKGSGEFGEQVTSKLSVGQDSANLLEVRKEAMDLMAKMRDSLRWIATQRVDKSNPEAPLSWTRMANGEVHIISKIEEYLEHYLNEGNQAAWGSLVKDGLQCNEVQREQQSVISKVIHMDICSEIEWYKLAQLTYPRAKTIIDVGGNKGYLGSLFLSLWGGGGYGVSPAALLEKAEQEGTWRGSRNPAGYCKDGFNHGIPLYCPANARRANGVCAEKHDGVTVTSFDGSGYLSETMNKMITTLAGAAPGVAAGKTWKYYHNAVSDAPGTARFTKQGKGQNFGAGFEGGKLRGNAVTEDTEEVTLVTVDDFLEKHFIEQLDILKIDAEGNDNKVISGARRAIDGGVALFTFEGGSGVTFTKEHIEDLDSRGFSCYSTSRAGLFKWSGGCMDEKYMGAFRAKDKGNVFCTSRKKAPLMAAVFDSLSFPMLIEQRGREGRERMGSKRKQKPLFDTNTREAGRFTDAYVNIRPFCAPFPACVADHL